MPDFLSAAQPDAFEAIDYLGKRSPVAFKDSPALPVAGPPVAPGAAGTGGGVAAGGPLVGQQGGGQPGALEPATGVNALTMLQGGLKLADLAKDILPGQGQTRGMGSPESEAALAEQRAGERASMVPAATEVLGPQLSEVAALAGKSVPSGLTGIPEGAAFTGTTLLPRAGVAEEAAMLGVPAPAGAAETAGTTLGDVLGVAGPAIGAAGSVFGAITAREPAEKALSAADAALYAISLAQPEVLPFAVGLSIVEAILGGGGFFSHEGPYAGKRAAARGQGEAGMGQLSGQIAGAKSLPELQTALEMSSTPAPLLQVPREDLARIGLEPGGLVYGGPQGQANVGFSQLTPEQFGKLLNLVRSDPERVRSWVAASGDVPYLPQEQAVSLQQAATGQVWQALQQAAASQASAPVVEATPMTSAGPVSVPVPGTEPSGGPLDVEQLVPA